MRTVAVDELEGAELDEWYRRSSAEREEEDQRALAVGRELWNAGTRLGVAIVGGTESELRALGRRELARQAAIAAGQVGAVGRAAANRMTLGAADQVAAAANAAIGLGDGDRFGERYYSNLEREHQRSAYDARHRPAAKLVGDVAGEALAFKGIGGRAAAAVSQLPPKAKGAVGEVLSAGKSLLLTDWPVALHASRRLAAGGRTVVDHITRTGKLVEAKFGPTARLSRQQRKAQAQFGKQYRVDHWQPYHVGRIAGGAGAGAASAYDEHDHR